MALKTTKIKVRQPNGTYKTITTTYDDSDENVVKKIGQQTTATPKATVTSQETSKKTNTNTNTLNSRSRMKESHLQRYNLDGTPKIPIADSITNRNIINLGEKNKLTDSLQNSISQKTGNINQQATPKIDLSGKSYLQDTGKTYGDYYYDNYSQNKDKKIYVNTKDGSYFLNNNGKYEKLGTGITSNINTMTTKAAEDKKVKEAKKQGYKGSQSSQKLEKYLNEVSKKTGFTNEELYTIASDYENGKWKPASSKYAEISSRLNKAGYQGYEVANKINKLKKESTQDINTTITNEVFPQKQIPWYKKILKGSEAFDDGYDVGDITKTVVATAQDIGANVGEGFLGTLEGISDTLQYGTADLMDLFKKKSAAKAIRNNAKFNSTAAIFGKNEKKEDNFVKGWTEKVDRNSVSGQGLDSISQGVGNIGAFVGTSYLTGGSSASSFLTTFSSAYGNAKSNAYQNGATDKTATETAIVSGLSEAISEQFFDKIPGMKTQGWGEKLVGKVGSKAEKYFGTKTGKVVMNILDNSGEGFEEIISDILNTTGNNIVHAIDKDYNGNLSLQTDTWLESFVYASITSALVNGGNTVLSNTQKNQILKAYAEENNMTLNQAKSVLNQEIQLRTDNIETNDLRERTNTEKETQKEILNEMQQKTYTADERISIPQEVEQEVRQEVIEDVQEQPNDKIVSVREVNKLISDTIKKSTLEYNAKEIAELRKAIYDEYKKLGVEIQESKNFIESAKENNFNTETEEIKSVGRIMEAKNIKFSFDSTPFINNSEAALWSIDNNGKRSVIFNPNADEKTIFQNVAVHELTHDLLSNKSSAEVLDKQDILEYISKTPGYDIARKSLEETYSQRYDRNSNEFKELVDEEVIASVLGSKLGNQEFINRLNGQKPNLARRIYNWVVDKIDNIGKSAEYKAEKKYWKNVANRFEKAFNMEYNNSTNKASTRHSFTNIGTFDQNEYNGIKEIHLPEAEYANVASIVNSDTSIVPGRNFIELYDYITEQYKNYEIYYKKYDEFKIMSAEPSYDYYSEVENNDTITERYSIGNETTRGRQGNSQWNNGKIENRTTSETNDELSNINQESRSSKGNNNQNGRPNNRELNSSFSNAKINDYEQMQNEIKSQIDKAYKIDEDFGKNMEKQYKEYREKNQLQYEILKNTKSRQAQNVNDDFFKEHESDYDGKSGTKTPDGKVTSIKLQKGDNLAKLSYTENADKIWIDELYVKNQNQGFGSEIVNAIKEYAERNDKDVEAFKELETAKGFWNKTLRNNNVETRYSKEAKEFNEFIDKNLKPTGTTGTLMAIHNLNEDKLKGVLELGGFPVPSIAITNPNIVNHDQFGNISVLFNKSTIDPAIAENEVYDRDVWSPTFPQIDYEINDDAIDEVAKKLGIENWRLRDAVEDNSKQEYLIERLLREESIIDNYVYDNNLEYETAYKDAETKVDFHQRGDKIRKFIIDNDFDFKKLYKDKTLQQEYFNLIKDYYDNSSFPEAVKENLYNEKITQLKDFIDIQKGAGDVEPIRQLKRYQDDFDLIKSGENKVVDTWQTDKNKKDIAIKNGIEDYLKEQVKDIYGEKGIRNDRDYLDSKGNRRSFWQLHDEYNLENIVDALTKGDTTGTQNWFAGYGQIQANMANQFNSIEDIKTNESRLTNLSETNQDLINARTNIENDIDEIVAKNDTDMNIVSELLADFARGDLTVDNFKELTRNYYQTTQNVPDKLINKVIDDMNALKNLPTDYFEAKPQRAVGLDEVEAIIIPNTASKELRDSIRNAGIDFVEYNPNAKGDRNRVINKFDNLKFSKNSSGEWQDFVNKNFSSKGKKTTFGELKNKNNNIPISKTFEKEESNKKIETKENNIKQEKNTPKEKNTIEERIPDVIEVRQSPMDKTSLNKLSKNMAKELYLNNSQTTDLKDVIQDFYRRDFNEYSKKDLFNSIKDKFSEHNEKIVADDSLNDIQQQIRNTKIKVPEQIKEGIGDYNNLRQSNFGKTKLGNTGIELDSFYDELASDYPAYFDSELTGEDQLLRIIDVANMDNSYTETYKLDDNYIQDITDYIDESIKDYKNEELRKLADKEIKAKYKEDKKTYAVPKKITHKEVRQQLLDEMKITPFELASGKDIKSLNYQITDPIRVNEKVFGAEMGKLINEATIEKTKHNTAEKIRFLNRERNDIKDLGIKARSKESAAVQKYAEKQYVNKYGEIVPYGDKELMAEFPNTKTQDKIKRAASMLRNKYDKYIDEINDVITALGYDPIPKRKDYMKHFQELGDVFSQTGVPFNLNDMKADELPTDINGLTEFNRPGKNWFASAQKRYGNKTTYDAITGIDTYLEGAANLIYHTADIQRYRALSQLVRDTFGQKKGFENLENLTEKEAIQRIEDIQNNKLSRYAAWLDEQANSLAGKKGAIDRGFERALGRRAYSFFNTIKKQVGSNMTGYNVRSAMTNFISSTIASSKTNKIAFTKGTISAINNLFKRDGFVNKSDFLTSRFGSKQLSNKLWQKLSNAGQVFMEGSDYFTANQIVRSKYYEGLQKGMTEKQAIDYADDFASRVMGDRSQGMTAEAFNSKTLGLLTQFQLETNNQWQYMIHDSVMDYQRGSKINGGLKAGATVLFQLGQLAAFSYLFNELFEKFTGSRAAFDPIDILKKLFGADDDDDKDKSWDKRLSEANAELVDSIPFGNIFTGGGRIPISEAFTGINTLTKKLTGQKNNYGGEITWDNVKDDMLGSLPYYVLPTGYGQIKKTAKGLSMFTNDKEIKGSYTKSGRLRFPVEDTPENKIQAALFGQYASKTAREYVNGGHSTLTENQQKELKVLDIPISDYWEIKSGLSDISNKLKGSNKTTDERKEIYYKYIDSLKINKDKKNLLKKLQYKSYTESDEDIKDYISSIKAKKTTKKDLLKKMGLDD